MVAPASSLSDNDRALLTVYIAVRFNLMELASQTSGDLLTLQDWALEPAIQAQVARYRQLEMLQHETEAADAKSAGIATLLDLLNTTQDPIERRRAAQTLIRVGSPDPARAEPQPRPANLPRLDRPLTEQPNLDLGQDDLECDDQSADESDESDANDPDIEHPAQTENGAPHRELIPVPVPADCPFPAAALPAPILTGTAPDIATRAHLSAGTSSPGP